MFFFFFIDPPTTEIYTLSLHDALPIFAPSGMIPAATKMLVSNPPGTVTDPLFNGETTLRETALGRSEEHTSELSHMSISYAVFCLKKKKKKKTPCHVRSSNRTAHAHPW